MERAAKRLVNEVKVSDLPTLKNSQSDQNFVIRLYVFAERNENGKIS